MPVRCIEVDSDDHLFIAGEGWTLTHNTQHWLANNDGLEMARVIRRNAAKTGGRALAITNAHRIGEGSVAEQDWEKYLADGDDGELLYDSVEAPDALDDEGKPKPLAEWTEDELRAGLLAARGDSDWVPIDRLLIDVRDDRDSEVYRRRFYLNQMRQETDTWITSDEWRKAERSEEVASGALITLGFDGSLDDDATALVATTVGTGYQWIVGVWQRPEGVASWTVPREEVELAVEAAFERYRVWRMYADPRWWEDTIMRWAGRWGADRVVFVHTNTQMVRLTRMIKAYETAVRTGELGHEPSAVFAAHVGNVVKHAVNIRDEDGERLYTLYKEHKGSPRKIDAAMAAVLSWGARLDALASGALEDEGSVYDERGLRWL